MVQELYDIRLGTDLSELVTLRPDRTMTTWDPAFFPGGEAFWLHGVNQGNAAFVIAARLFKAFDFHRDLESLRVIYRNPEMFQDFLEVNSGHFPQIKGDVAHTGNCWVAPEFRGQGVSALANRAIHREILQRWDVDWIWGLQEKELAYKGLWQDWGHAHCEGQVIWDHNPYAQRFDMKVVYGSRDEISRNLV